MNAFTFGENLRSATFYSQIPPVLGIYAFRNTHVDLVIRVPAESITAYRNEWGPLLQVGYDLPPEPHRIIAIEE